jgi:formate hydrogenlyase subunit 4
MSKFSFLYELRKEVIIPQTRKELYDLVPHISFSALCLIAASVSQPVSGGENFRVAGRSSVPGKSPD